MALLRILLAETKESKSWNGMHTAIATNR